MRPQKRAYSRNTIDIANCPDPNKSRYQQFRLYINIYTGWVVEMLTVYWIFFQIETWRSDIRLKKEGRCIPGWRSFNLHALFNKGSQPQLDKMHHIPWQLVGSVKCCRQLQLLNNACRLNDLHILLTSFWLNLYIMKLSSLKNYQSFSVIKRSDHKWANKFQRTLHFTKF